MNNNVYLQFKRPESKPSPPPGRIQKAIENVLTKIFSSILPKANPDFEHKFHKVEYWEIEYNTEDNYTSREIGYDKEGNSIVAMPYRDNYGYWTDNHLTLEDYNRFNPKLLEAEDFERNWKEFIE